MSSSLFLLQPSATSDPLSVRVDLPTPDVAHTGPGAVWSSVTCFFPSLGGVHHVRGTRFIPLVQNGLPLQGQCVEGRSVLPAGGLGVRATGVLASVGGRVCNPPPSVLVIPVL